MIRHYYDHEGTYTVTVIKGNRVVARFTSFRWCAALDLWAAFALANLA